CPSADALGKRARTGTGCGRKHDRQETHPLRTGAVFLDRDVRPQNGFRGRFQPAAYADKPEGHLREEKIRRPPLSGRETPRVAALPGDAEGSGQRQDRIADGAREVVPRVTACNRKSPGRDCAPRPASSPTAT